MGGEVDGEIDKEKEEYKEYDEKDGEEEDGEEEEEREEADRGRRRGGCGLWLVGQRLQAIHPSQHLVDE